VTIDVSGLGNLPDLTLTPEQVKQITAKLGTLPQAQIDALRAKLRQMADDHDLANAIVRNSVTILQLAALLA